MTQVNPTYPMIFNIVVDLVVWVVLDMVCSPKKVQYGMGWVAGEINIVF